MRTLAAALALATLVLPACGGGDDDGGRTATVAAGETIAISGNDDYEFDPENVVLTGNPRRIEIEFTNEGSLAHNVKVFKGADELGGSPTFQGGTRNATVQLSGPGEYELICTVGDHEELGMVGSLEVRE